MNLKPSVSQSHIKICVLVILTSFSLVRNFKRFFKVLRVTPVTAHNIFISFGNTELLDSFFNLSHVHRLLRACLSALIKVAKPFGICIFLLSLSKQNTECLPRSLKLYFIVNARK